MAAYPRISSNCMILLLIALSQSVLATLSLQQLQAIDAFPSSCMAAYKNPISLCPDSSAFSPISGPKSSSACSIDCISALEAATTSIQRACAGSSAPPGTIIAHAFSGDLASFLCTFNSNSQTSSNTKPAIAPTPQIQTGTTTKVATDTSSSGSSRTQTAKSDSTSISGSNTSNSPTQSTLSTLTSASASSSSATASQTSSASSESSASSISASPSPSSSSSSSSSQQTLRPGGGGSPFDQTVPNAAPTMDASQNMLSLAVGVAVAVVLGN